MGVPILWPDSCRHIRMSYHQRGGSRTVDTDAHSDSSMAFINVMPVWCTRQTQRHTHTHTYAHTHTHQGVCCVSASRSRRPKPHTHRQCAGSRPCQNRSVRVPGHTSSRSLRHRAWGLKVCAGSRDAAGGSSIEDLTTTRHIACSWDLRIWMARQAAPWQAVSHRLRQRPALGLAQSRTFGKIFRQSTGAL